MPRRPLPYLLLLLALLMAGCAQRAPARAGAPGVELHDGESWVSVHGAEHWVRIAAAARRTTPIVIVHGGPGGNNYAFERTIGPELERFATIVYYEQRGCGRSKLPADRDYSMPTLVADLDALRERLGLERIHVLGYSFGAELALEYTLSHPNRVDHLFLQAPTFGRPDRTDALQIDGFEAVSQGEIHDRIRDILRSPGSNKEHLGRIWEVVDTNTVNAFLMQDQAKASMMRRLWDESHLGPNKDMREHYLQPRTGEPLLWRARGLRVPTLVLVGLHDRNVGVDGPRELSRVMAHSRLSIFEQSAHFPDIEEPLKYAAAVKEFLSAP